VSSPSFLFALTLAGGSPFDPMLGELAASLFRRLGYAGQALDDLLGGFREALARRATSGSDRCDVRFQVDAGRLLIIVSYAEGDEWRATRALPA